MPDLGLIVRLAVENAQNGEEEVDDVQVQADRRRNLLLDMMLPHHHLRIHQDISTEDQRRRPAVQQLTGRAVGEEHGHEAEEDEAPQRAKQVRHPRCEVVLGLAGEGGQEDEDACREDDGVEHDGRLVERHDDAHRVRLGEGEEREEEEVGRVGLALPVGEAEEDEGADELDMVSWARCWM